MQNNATERIKSALSNRLILWVLAFVLVIAVLYISFSPSSSNKRLKVPNSSRTYSLQVADTAEKRSVGLGGTDSLPNDQGMLFVFPVSSHSCMWMKGMKYALDMVWLDENKKVVNVSAHIQPSTYPDQVFCSQIKKSKYVIELNAGEIEAAHIGFGQTLKF